MQALCSPLLLAHETSHAMKKSFRSEHVEKYINTWEFVRYMYIASLF